MKAIGSFPCSQEPTTGPNRERDKIYRGFPYQRSRGAALCGTGRPDFTIRESDFCPRVSAWETETPCISDGTSSLVSGNRKTNTSRNPSHPLPPAGGWTVTCNGGQCCDTGTCFCSSHKSEASSWDFLIATLVPSLFFASEGRALKRPADVGRLESNEKTCSIELLPFFNDVLFCIHLCMLQRALNYGLGKN
jgi:hypothetical protein